MIIDQTTPRYSDLAKFEVVAMGIHRKIMDDLTSYLSECHSINAFQLVEYFLWKPVIRNSHTPELVFFPFLRRLLDQNKFHLVRDGVIPLNKKRRDSIEFEIIDHQWLPRQFVLPFSGAQVGKLVFDLWLNENMQDKSDDKSYFKTYTKYDWDEFEKMGNSENDRYKDLCNLEFDLVGRYWQSCVNSFVSVVGVYPIASREVFYGYFVIIWPELAEEADPEKQIQIRKNVLEKLQQHSDDNYVPTLALLHNSLLEDWVHNKINKGEPKNDVTLLSFIDDLLCRWSENSESDIERGLALLWRNRKDLLNSSLKNKLELFDDTLLFRGYNFASREMIDQIRKIIQRAPNLLQPKPGEKLPTVLIYGEAGTGKDIMAKLIQLFTMQSWRSQKPIESSQGGHLGYFGMTPRVINMSALKPNALFGPLFLGMNLNDLKQNLSIPSLLTLVRENTAKKTDVAGVFILDELNSLGVDLQGVLLRILENGEVTPLFDVDPKYVLHLVIGIVNEDPEVLTREYETKNLKRIKDFTGEFFGNLIYELLTSGRRLRPDLYYRLKRGLFIKIPSLRERREDIPILFYFECENAVRQELHNNGINSINRKIDQVFQESKEIVHFELQAFETLMESSLDWPGNVRQLQSVATDVAVVAVREFLNPKNENNDLNKSGIVSVTDSMVKKTLRDYFPNALF